MDFYRSARGSEKHSRNGGNRDQNLPKTVLRRAAIARAVLEVMECRLMMSSTTWTGGAYDNQWTSPGNWAGGSAPVTGDDVTFPSNSGIQQQINLPTAVEVGNFNINGNYQFNDISSGGGAAITVDGNIDSESNGTQINNTLTLNNSNLTINVGTGDDLTLSEINDNGNGYGFTKTGNGLLDLEGFADFYSGATDISAGTVDVAANLSSDPVEVDTGATLEGTSILYDIQALGGTVSLNDLGGNPSTLTSFGSVSLANSTLQEVISSTSSVESDGMLAADGSSLFVTGATLDISVQNGYTPAIGDQFTLISNNTGRPVTGTFGGLPEGSQTTVNGVTYQITYQGNNANDVVLTVVPSTDVWAGGVDNNWNTAGNWQSGTVPASGDNIVLPDLGHIQAINLTGNVNVGNITLSGNYTINSNGNSLSPSGTITSYSTGSTINGLVLSDNTTINIGASANLALNNISGSYSIDKTGPGTLILGNSTDTHSGTVVSSGTLEDDGSQSSGITVDTGATLDGSGTPSGITSNGGTISLGTAAGPQTLSSSGAISLDSGSTLQEVINQVGGIETDGELSATGHFQYVSLNGATLEITTLNGFKPAIGDVITLISNGTDTGISSTFNGLAEGAVTNVNGVNYQVSYVGGSSGHDVTLTVVPDVWIGANNGNWSDAGNWQSGVVPASGDSVEFPFRNPNLCTVNLTGNVTVGDITFDGNYQLANDTVTLDGNITSNSTGLSTAIVSQLVLAHNATVTVGAAKILGLYSAGNGGNGYGITKAGAGTLFFLGGNGPGFTAATEVAQGALEVDNLTTPSSVTVDAGATLQGNGTAAGITDNGGTVLLNQFLGYGTTLASSGPVSLGSGSTLHEIISNSGITETDGKLVATGSSVNLTGSTLTLSALYGFTPAIGDVITLISNQTGSAITGTFNGLAEGAVFNANGVNYQISYVGGSSNEDVTLTVVADTWSGGGGNNLWSNPYNWQSGAVPASGDTIVLPDLGSGKTISLDSSVTVGDLTLNGNYTINGNGNSFDLNGAVTSASSHSSTINGLSLDQNATVNVGSGGSLAINGISGTYDLTKTGFGQLTLGGGSDIFYGNVTVLSGILENDISLGSGVTIDTGALFVGSGAVNGITDFGGTVISGMGGNGGQLTDFGSLALFSNSTLVSQLDGSTVGTGSGHYAQVIAHGVSLYSTTLIANIGPDYTPAPGDVLTLISNTGSLTGTFSGLPQGATITLSGHLFQISYTGGAGHDVTLTAVEPPLVGVNPTNTTVNAGANASFTSSAAGYPVPTAQWQVSTNGGVNFSNITDGGVYSGATTATLTITGGLASMNGYEYQDVFTNGVGSAATTTPATLTVDSDPTVTTNPWNTTVNDGGNIFFSAAATGNPTPTVQWQVSVDGGATFNNITNGGVYSDATTNTLSIIGATASMDTDEYRAVFSNTLSGAGSPSTATTNPATLTVDNAPSIAINPSNTTVNANGNTSLSAAATGDPTPTVQWQLSINGGATFNNLTNGGFYSGVTTNTLSITSAQAFMSSYMYRAVYSNTLLGASSPSTATTAPATLTVDAAPTVTSNPTNQTINAGSNTIYNATADGTPTPTVQWQVSTDGGATFTNIVNGGIYSGSTTNTLSISNATGSMNTYQYHAVFSNLLSGASSPTTATTTAATLTVDTAPIVGGSPSNVTINAGSNTTFTSSATGTPSPTEQWQVSTNGGATFTNITNGGVYSGATTTTLSITSGTANMNGYQYRDLFTNSNSSIATAPSTLTVDVAPMVTTNPVNSTIGTGGTTSFTVAATGNPTPTVQWQVSTDGGQTFSNITSGGIYSGATTNTLTLTGATPTENGYRYHAVFSNTLFGAGSPTTATTTTATLSVTNAPVIGVNPTNVTITAGGNASLTSSASGNPTPTGQWQVSTDGGATFNNINNGGVYTGATTGTLSIIAATSAMNGYQYRDVFTNGNGTATTGVSTLTVDDAPTVVTSPSSVSIDSGGNATLTSSATGNPTPTAQWQVSTDGGATFNNIVDGGVYSGATTSTLSITGGSFDMNGDQFRDVFTNGSGTASTVASTLTVGNPPPTIVNPLMPRTASGKSVGLKVLGSDSATASDAGMTYRWSLLSAPVGAKAPIFAANGTHAAKQTRVAFSKAGTYRLQLVATDSEGETVTTSQSITISQTGTSLRLTPHGQVQHRGTTEQFAGVVLDQFKHPLRVQPTFTFSLQSGVGSITAAGLFNTGNKIGHAIIEGDAGGLSGMLGVKVV